MSVAQWIMVAGPYTSGALTRDDRSRNLDVLNRAALVIFNKGHVPVIGVNLALPIIDRAAPERYDEIMMPLSLAVAERCDAVLRIGGPSRGAEQEVAAIAARGGIVYEFLDDIPEVSR